MLRLIHTGTFFVRVPKKQICVEDCTPQIGRPGPKRLPGEDRKGDIRLRFKRRGSSPDVFDNI